MSVPFTNFTKSRDYLTGTQNDILTRNVFRPGAITVDEAMQTGLTESELKTGSFLTILDGRRHLAKQ